MSLEEDQEALKPIMRQQELQRRATRNAVIKNHAALVNDLSKEEKEYIRKLNPDNRSYFKRLWDALLNRK